MVFSSPAFLFGFLPCFVLVYCALPSRYRLHALTFFSYGFYAWWDARYAPLLLVSTVLNFGLARLVASDDQARARGALVVGVTLNLLLLAVFKYTGFVAHTATSVASALGLSWSLAGVAVPLPPGISFFTFHGISYLADVSRKATQPTRDFGRFACYFAMFPHLVAGPIVRYAHVADQLANHRLSAAQTYAGIQIFILGLCKKTLIADVVAFLPDTFYARLASGELGALDALCAITAYSVQIYFDFSGYSDMAVGLGKICGFDFPINFDSPYRSRSITEFWRRWHISLSTWLRDYLYIPLGGSRGSELATYRNLIVTMLLGGLWHGAGWNWVLWGGLHGVLLAIEKALGDRNPLTRLPGAIQMLVTFALTAHLWVFFRAATLDDSLATFRAMYAGNGSGFHMPSLEQGPLSLAMLAVGIAVALWPRNTNQLSSTPSVGRTLGLAAGFGLSLLFIYGSVSHPFLYFQF